MLREFCIPLLITVVIVGLWLYTRLVPQEHSQTHAPAVHGGIVVPLAAGRYHAEAVFGQGGALRLYMLGPDASRVVDVEAQTLTAYVKAPGQLQAVRVALQAEPQPDDRPGRTSQFVGQLPAGLEAQALEVTIPQMRIEGGRFRLGFASSHNDPQHMMPAKVEDDQERELYLVPGGKYTQADIEANGRMTASQKFLGFRAQHDFNPSPGDKLCPVTRTKANPQCSWIIGGKTYEFCCPPCVDEFVLLAKQDPDEVQEPQAYVKQ